MPWQIATAGYGVGRPKAGPSGAGAGTRPSPGRHAALTRPSCGPHRALTRPWRADLSRGGRGDLAQGDGGTQWEGVALVEASHPPGLLGGWLSGKFDVP